MPNPTTPPTPSASYFPAERTICEIANDGTPLTAVIDFIREHNESGVKAFCGNLRRIVEESAAQEISLPIQS